MMRGIDLGVDENDTVSDGEKAMFVIGWTLCSSRRMPRRLCLRV